MKNALNGKRVAILVTDGFEQVELTGPREALEKAGAETNIVSPAGKTVRAWDMTKWGKTFSVDVPLKKAKADDYDALLLPGGVLNPDKLRIDPKAVQFTREFFDSGKPVAAICHGPWTLINAGVVEGRRMTSYPSVKVDLQNAGADWVDEQVVVDNGLVTSRKPADIRPSTEKSSKNSPKASTTARKGHASRQRLKASFSWNGVEVPIGIGTSSRSHVSRSHALTGSLIPDHCSLISR